MQLEPCPPVQQAREDPPRLGVLYKIGRELGGDERNIGGFYVVKIDVARPAGWPAAALRQRRST